jgi:putative endonuclease
MDMRKIRGARGEDIAAEYLVQRGFRVIDRNWNHRLGEIDLIVERDGETRFIEVKLRRSMTYGYPEASITGLKLRHLARAIECWMNTQVRPPERYQVDAIAIFASYGSLPDINWIQGIM